MLHRAGVRHTDSTPRRIRSREEGAKLRLRREHADEAELGRQPFPAWREHHAGHEDQSNSGQALQTSNRAGQGESDRSDHSAERDERGDRSGGEDGDALQANVSRRPRIDDHARDTRGRVARRTD